MFQPSIQHGGQIGVKHPETPSIIESAMDSTLSIAGGYYKKWGFHSWIVYIMEHPLSMDDLGVPLWIGHLHIIQQLFLPIQGLLRNFVARPPARLAEPRNGSKKFACQNNIMMLFSNSSRDRWKLMEAADVG